MTLRRAALACVALGGCASLASENAGEAGVPRCRDGEGSALVTGGTFRMGDPLPDDDTARPVHDVRVSTFCMALTEVTVDAYRACPAATCTEPASQGSCNWSIPGRGNHPLNCVDWFQARAYCRWAGGDLPTAAQWEYAARGTDGRTYPWGDDAPLAQLCWSTSADRASTCVVGSFPAGRSAFGMSDMAGNVWEWTRDWFAAFDPAGAPLVDPAGPATGSRREVRGGGVDIFAGVGLYVRAAYRGAGVTPHEQDGILGFRCAFPAR